MSKEQKPDKLIQISVGVTREQKAFLDAYGRRPGYSAGQAVRAAIDAMMRKLNPKSKGE